MTIVLHSHRPLPNRQARRSPPGASAMPLPDSGRQARLSPEISGCKGRRPLLLARGQKICPVIDQWRARPWVNFLF
ncbi:MAG: hypothetical protein NDI70_03220 [Pseudomonas sagittaria]|uniref:hypothetical protein n=1 Tax=Geopseudomonas sagittaria TaxID=1135990 RepID=UPI0015870834|nr:hypothetical protein [Pseudomonas sagittaria]MCM2330290.1 hypothetical protein [Pseudomonas sagittaria]